MIDWEFFREEIVLACGYSGFGRPPHDAVLMFKILVLQRYYDLSEEQTEFQILDRPSFQRFLGLEAGGKIPDKRSFWDFKERFGEDGARGLFERQPVPIQTAQLHNGISKLAGRPSETPTRA